MSSERGVRIVAGTFVPLSLGLGADGSPTFVNANWLGFTAFVGLNLVQSGFTAFCPVQLILRRLGMRDGAPAHPAR